MKFKCSKSILHEALNNVSIAVSAKSTLPILEGILLICKNNTLTLTCYNLELGITTSININSIKDGQIVLNTTLMSNIISKMPDGEISFEIGENYSTQIICNNIEFTILGQDPTSFPELPIIINDDNNKNLLIPQHLLRNMLEQTLFAAATNEQSPINTGCLFDIKNHMLTIVSVDGLRLALRKEPISINDEIKIIVPAKTLSDILKLFSRILNSDEETDIKILTSNNHIVFDIKGYYIISRLLEGEFMDYNKVISNTPKTTVKVKTKNLIDSTNRASIVISEKVKTPIKSNFTNDTINILCESSLGKINETIECETQGDEVRLGYNNKYMLDALKACDCEEIIIELSGPLSAIKILPVDGDNFLFLVLPIRLKDDN